MHGRSHASEIPSSCVEYEDFLSLRSHIQALQATNENLFSHRARNQKIHIDRLLQLRAEKKKTRVLESEVHRLTQQLPEVCTAKEKVFFVVQDAKDS